MRFKRSPARAIRAFNASWSFGLVLRPEQQGGRGCEARVKCEYKPDSSMLLKKANS